MNNTAQLLRGNKIISTELGIISHTIRLPRMYHDPKLMNFGIWPCNTLELGAEKFEGRSGACNEVWDQAMLATIGETIERYTPTFFPKDAGIKSAYKDLKVNAIHPDECAFFHEKQYPQFKELNYNVIPFTEDTVMTWVPTTDLTTGEEMYCPAQVLYMPFTQDPHYISVSNSTGLSAHTNYHKAILTSLYECIERDSFVITWMNNLVAPKIKIDPVIQKFLSDRFPPTYEWHLFDITYDLEVPTVFGMCFGESDFGKFVAVGSAARGTIGEAAMKVIQEIGQTSPYFRWILGEKTDWMPDDDYNKLMDFSDHSIFYMKRTDMWGVFDKWRNAEETKEVTFYEKDDRSDVQKIKDILHVFKKKNYNVMLRDLTTVDAKQLGFYSLKIYIPQLIQMSGGYAFYFSGGKRLYDVPEQMGYPRLTYDTLNKFPHPFP